MFRRERNVMGHLAERDRPQVKARLRRAWAETDHVRALEQLEVLVGELDRTHPGAAGSMREGMAETLTVWSAERRYRRSRWLVAERNWTVGALVGHRGKPAVDVRHVDVLVDRHGERRSAVDVERDPNRVAVVDEPGVVGELGRMTFSELFDRVAGMAVALDALGVRPGDRVAYLGPNAAKFLIALFAVTGTGRGNSILRDAEEVVVVAPGKVVRPSKPEAEVWPDARPVGVAVAGPAVRIGHLAVRDLVSGEIDVLCAAEVRSAGLA
jgi:hypothetical protein